MVNLILMQALYLVFEKKNWKFNWLQVLTYMYVHMVQALEYFSWYLIQNFLIFPKGKNKIKLEYEKYHACLISFFQHITFFLNN